ncbi:hypothetical protein [Nocardia sp. NPDC058480]
MPVTTESWTDDHKSDTSGLFIRDNDLLAWQLADCALVEIRRRR